MSLTLRDVPDAITALMHGDVAPLAENDLVGLDGRPVATHGTERLVLLAPTTSIFWWKVMVGR